MSILNNSKVLGSPGQNIVLETAGRVYIKVADRYYELDFKNQHNESATTIINNPVEIQKEEPDTSKFVTKDFLKSYMANYVTKRSWNDVKETQSKLERALLEGFTETINPITLNTMQVIVGSEQLQFEFIKSLTNDEKAEIYPYIDDSGNLVCDEGFIKHYTLEGPEAVQPDKGLKQYARWKVIGDREHEDGNHFASFELPEKDQAYYLYIVADKLNWTQEDVDAADDPTNKKGIYAKTGEAHYMVSQEALPLEIEDSQDMEDKYYLLYAIINSEENETRSISTLNGFTEILPGQITAYLFKSPTGDSFIDLENNTIKLGDKLTYNLSPAGVHDGALRIKGAILQDDGGNSSYAPVDRGEYTINTTYYPGNLVTYSDSSGAISTYMYIYETPGSSSNPNWPEDTTHWKIFAQGSSSGRPGSTTRMRKWVADGNTSYYNGTVPDENDNYWLDFVYYNGNYYKCIITYTPTSGGATPDASGNWVQVSQYSFIATSVLFAGTGTDGWILDNGILTHTSGKISLNRAGEIKAANGNFKVDSEGNLSANTADIQGSSKIGGFHISSNGGLTSIYNEDSQVNPYIIARGQRTTITSAGGDKKEGYNDARIGANVLPGSIGVEGVGYFENSTPHGYYTSRQVPHTSKCYDMYDFLHHEVTIHLLDPEDLELYSLYDSFEHWFQTQSWYAFVSEYVQGRGVFTYQSHYDYSSDEEILDSISGSYNETVYDWTPLFGSRNYGVMIDCKNAADNISLDVKNGYAIFKGDGISVLAESYVGQVYSDTLALYLGKTNLFNFNLVPSNSTVVNLPTKSELDDINSKDYIFQFTIVNSSYSGTFKLCGHYGSRSCYLYKGSSTAVSSSETMIGDSKCTNYLNIGPGDSITLMGSKKSNTISYYVTAQIS